MALSTKNKILVGAAAVGGIGLVYYLFFSKKTAAAATMAPQQVQSFPAPTVGAGARPPAGSMGIGSGPGGGSSAPVSRFAVSPGASFAPVSFAAQPSGGGGAPVPAPMPTNVVQTKNGYVSWGAGASYNAQTGVITNTSNSSVSITTPQGTFNLSPGMTYNVNTGEIGF